MASLRRDIAVMTMYLSNQDVRPTGYEPGEFIETVTEVPAAEPTLATSEVDDEADETSV
jgi:hypothetical protein